MSLVDIHKKRLRKKRRLRHSRSTTSTATSATTTTFHSSSSGFSRLGSSASNSASRSILSSTSTRGRKYRRRNLASSVRTNSTYCGPSGATNNNSLVLIDEGSNPNPSLTSQKSQSKSINTGNIVKLTTEDPSIIVQERPEGNNNNFVPNTTLLKAPNASTDNKTSLIRDLTSSDSVKKLNSPSLLRQQEPINTEGGGKKVIAENNLQMISTPDSSEEEMCHLIQQQKQAIQMNVLGLGTVLATAEDKQLLDADEIKIDYDFIKIDDDDDHPAEQQLSIVPLSKVPNETDKDQKLSRFGINTDKKPKQGKHKFHRYISMDMEGEEEFFDDELGIDDDDYERDYDDHDDFIDDEDEDDDDGEEVYHVGNLDEMEYLENITSCNKVENVVMLSEYEQNLIKESEDIGGSDSGITGVSPSYNRMYKTKSGKRWFKIKDKKGKNNTPPRSSETLIHRNKKWNQVLPGPSRAITTIEENSSS